jgi:hypothetical protein
MLEQDRFGFTTVNRGFPGVLAKGESKFNEIWGQDYHVFVFGDPNESVMALLIDGMILMKKTETQRYY